MSELDTLTIDVVFSCVLFFQIYLCCMCVLCVCSIISNMLITPIASECQDVYVVCLHV